ncbi:allophanate hydrolase [Cypionkella aquatica]|uniref:Allophanate hydrolase n=1 Tax=Cypionkella aquatica TaxID=1756042 RepID=A0AA37X101_9RHOB|nr:allophanate hydrolase subunit 1 [Cypionkella aquatica]GLS86270.1 allophanate hydrolase [Cypionkella aquatica]
MQPTPQAPLFRPCAERAVLVEFGTTLDPGAHNAVLQLDQALTDTPCAGFVESVPAFINLLVVFDPLLTDHPSVTAHLRHLLTAETAPRAQPAQREVQVCYDADLSPDLPAVAQACGLTPDAVINAHLAGDYAVFLYGFAPGYAYLGGVPEVIRLDRKPSPVGGVAAGSVIIAGAQCLVTTLTMPTGWWIIGRSPTRILTGDTARPFLFDVGDKVRFRRIARAEYEAAK